MIIPFMSSLSDDAITAVPTSLRDGSFGLGATRSETIRHVIVPAALPGIMGGFLLAVSRAIGETMIVAVAAGMQPNLTFDPTEPAATITAYIVQVAKGDLPHGSVGYQTIFAAGLTLFLLTLAFNLVGFWLRKRYREAY
jgi:phosphate transport system permease protein